MSHKIIIGDCLEEMKYFEDNSIPLIVTSPPYNMKTSTGGGFKGKADAGLWKNAGLKNGYNSYSDNLSVEDYAKWQGEILAEMWRLIPENGAIFYNHKPRIQAGRVLLPQSYAPDYMILRQVIIWDRSCGFNFNRSFFTPSHEYILLFAKKDFRFTKHNPDRDIWKINFEKNNSHPAPFPVELAKKCIEHTDAELVLDPFSGSGSTGVATLALGRSYVGIECDTGYAANSIVRLGKAA